MFLKLPTLLFCILCIQSITSKYPPNCLVYNISSNSSITCSTCIYGYDLDENRDCTPMFLIRAVGLLLSVKYFTPMFQFKNIFADFME